MSLGGTAQNTLTEPVVTLTADSAGELRVSDSALLFSAEFERSGPDLYLRSDAGPDLRIPGYFLTDTPADLLDANGAILRGDLVARLAGPVAPGQYAQNGGAVTASPIGQVETLAGGASVQRADGTVEQLSLGMKIFAQDVVQTDAGGKLSVTFVDGTIFTLASGSRMVIDSLIYDPDSTSNSGGFDLIQGGFVFIAGQVAKSGGMEVSTPSATMGIRGTTVVVEISSRDGVVTSEITLVEDIDGDIGHIEVRDDNGVLLADITETESKWLVEASGGEIREVARDPQDRLADSLIVGEAFAAFRAATTRVEAGDTFVTLGDPAPVENRTDPGSVEDRNFDVDPNDEIDITPPPNDNNVQPAPPPTDPGQPFDEGQNQQQEVPQNRADFVTVQGTEDATNPIIGTVGVPGSGTSNFAVGQGPQNGFVAVDADGSFSFTPDPDFNGTDIFTVTGSAANGSDVETTVVVEVLAVNDAPEVQDVTAVMVEDGMLSGILDFQDVDGDSLSFGVTDVPLSGEVLLFQNGNYVYTPDANFEGVDRFKVEVTDPDGAKATAEILITIQAQEDAPIIKTTQDDVARYMTESDVAVAVGGTLVAEDPDAGSNITWSGSMEGSFGRFEVTAGGTWSYTLDPDRADVLMAGETATDTFAAVVTDNTGLSETLTIPITITGTNDSPTAANITVFDTVADAQVAGVLQAVDAETDPSDLRYELSGTQPAQGALQLNTDGSFVYTPDAGFVGVEQFEYSVTDQAGDTVTSRAAIAVASAPSASQNVSVRLSGGPEPGAPAGAVHIGIDQLATPAVNLGLALDRSDSMGETAWNQLLGTVNGALEALGEQFAGADNAVDVQVISVATTSDATPVYDIQDPALLTEITPANLPWVGGATGWKFALQRGVEFFFSQPVQEQGTLLFVTNGPPEYVDWEVARNELLQSPQGFDVTLKAFGFGPDFVEGSLDGLDPGAALLTGPEDLIAAFGHLPVFNPELIGFQVELLADGQDSLLIADETHAALTVEGTDFDLPLASIDNIATLLGESNRVNITAQFDLDNDLQTTETTVFSSVHVGKAATPQIVTGSEGADLLLGSDGADLITGGAGGDVILGYDGDDTLSGGAGADTLMAGGGDDVIVIATTPEAGDVVDGGAGRDVLEITALGEINAMLAELDFSDVEALDLNNGQQNALDLTVDMLIDFSDTSDGDLQALLDSALPNTHTITGAQGDSLALDGQGIYDVTAAGTVTDAEGTTLNVFTFQLGGGNPLAALGVDSDIAVTTANFVTV